jgi:hypothetical protein
MERFKTDDFMQQALELDGGRFPSFGNRSKYDDERLSGAQLFRAHVLGALGMLIEKPTLNHEESDCRWCGKRIRRYPNGYDNHWNHLDSRGLLVGDKCYPRELFAEPK